MTIGEVHELKTLNHEGDAVTRWDPNRPDEVEVARAMFDSLKKKGYLAYTVTDGDARGEVIRSFDPALGKIMMMRQPVGG